MLRNGWMWMMSAWWTPQIAWVTRLMQTGKVKYIRYRGGRLIHKSGTILPEYIKEDNQ